MICTTEVKNTNPFNPLTIYIVYNKDFFTINCKLMFMDKTVICYIMCIFDEKSKIHNEEIVELEHDWLDKMFVVQYNGLKKEFIYYYPLYLDDLKIHLNCFWHEHLKREIINNIG